jgi:7,8-dihydropterin-6-yl-methyl-4-(beta-D-ribofuranosyl)aminobenzene 5'-phosphate synthase
MSSALLIFLSPLGRFYHTGGEVCYNNDMNNIRVTALLENIGTEGLIARHGLCLYVETPAHKLLFDVGPDGSFARNARALGIDLAAVDTVIISHGHNDHGGGLEAFLEVNDSAKIYVQRAAFEKHYSKVGPFRISCGLKRGLAEHPQMVLVDGDTRIDDELFLFTVSERSKCCSPANDKLYDRGGKDSFGHEQNLIISAGGKNLLITGCGHTGIVNILEAAQGFGVASPDTVIGGFHLMNPATGRPISDEILGEIASELGKYDAEFYTCHCTGLFAYNYLASKVKNFAYLSCGGVIEVA